MLLTLTFLIGTTFSLELWEMSTFFDASNKDFNSLGSVAEIVFVVDFSFGSKPAKCGASPKGSVVNNARFVPTCSGGWNKLNTNRNCDILKEELLQTHVC